MNDGARALPNGEFRAGGSPQDFDEIFNRLSLPGENDGRGGGQGGGEDMLNGVGATLPAEDDIVRGAWEAPAHSRGAAGGRRPLSYAPGPGLGPGPIGPRSSGLVSAGGNAPSRPKSVVDLIQNDFPRTASPVYKYGPPGSPQHIEHQQQLAAQQQQQLLAAQQQQHLAQQQMSQMSRPRSHMGNSSLDEQGDFDHTVGDGVSPDDALEAIEELAAQMRQPKGQNDSTGRGLPAATFAYQQPQYQPQQQHSQQQHQQYPNHQQHFMQQQMMQNMYGMGNPGMDSGFPAAGSNPAFAGAWRHEAGPGLTQYGRGGMYPPSQPAASHGGMSQHQHQQALQAMAAAAAETASNPKAQQWGSGGSEMYAAALQAVRALQEQGGGMQQSAGAGYAEQDQMQQLQVMMAAMMNSQGGVQGEGAAMNSLDPRTGRKNGSNGRWPAGEREQGAPHGGGRGGGFERSNQLRGGDRRGQRRGVDPRGGADKNGNAREMSALLEEFKNNKVSRRFDLADIAGHALEFSMDQHGSRFIQQKLEQVEDSEKDMVFAEIIEHCRDLMTDVFGNYVIQKFFEHGTPRQHSELASRIQGNVLTLSLQMYGCRVIQKALEVIDEDSQKAFCEEVRGHEMRCVKDQNGNHVIQKCIECVAPGHIEFIVDTFMAHIISLSTHPYGCRVIQRMLEHCTQPQKDAVMNEIRSNVHSLAQDQYGNYVVQHVLEHGVQQDRALIIKELAGRLVSMSQHKFASNVVEKCLVFGDRADRDVLIQQMLGPNDSNEHLKAMIKDQYANYVVQKALDVSDEDQKERVLDRIRAHIVVLKKYTYGKHIAQRVERQGSGGSAGLESRGSGGRQGAR